MSVFKHGFLIGTGTRTEFQLHTLGPRTNLDPHPYINGIETRDIDSIIGPENPNANFRHAPYHCSYHYPGYKDDDAIGFVICSWDKNEIKHLSLLFVRYLIEYLSKYEPIDYERYKSSLFKIEIEDKNLIESK